MHRPGHFMGSVITATGVTPDIVLASFFIVYSTKGVIISLAGLSLGNNQSLYLAGKSSERPSGARKISVKGSTRGAKPLFKNPSPSPSKERGIKRVPRKIFDFPGCLKGVRWSLAQKMSSTR